MYKNVKFNDIAGYEYQKAEAMKIAEFFKNYDEFVKKGAFLTKGAIFYGPCGTGKTLFANAIANEANVKTFNISNEEFYKATNTSEKIKQVFNQAKEESPCIIFIDEIDTIVPTRKDNSDSRSENLRVLLTSIDDIQKTGVMVIATSNSALETLPSSLVRNGRIEKHIHVGLPDLQDRIALLKLYFKGKDAFNNINPELVASYTNHFSCSSIESLVNDVLINSILNHKEVTFRDFIDPISAIKLRGIKTKQIKNNDYVIIHEVGHFICDYVLRGNIGFLNAISYNNVGGRYEEIDDDFSIKNLLTFDDIFKECVVGIGGLAATEVYFGVKYSGASNDLNKIIVIYNNAVNEGLVGFNELSHIGTISFFNQGLIRPSTLIDLNNELSVRRLKFLNDIYEKAKEIITNNKELCDILISNLKNNPILLKTDNEKIIDDYKKNKENKDDN